MSKIKTGEQHCWGCKNKWYDNKRYQRCSENSTARFYFRCQKKDQDNCLVSANLLLPRIERVSR